MWYSPESTSNGTILHYINCWLAGKFQSRCGGVQYDLGHVRAPVDVFWAPKDWAAGQRDIDSIVGQLENREAAATQWHLKTDPVSTVDLP